MSEFYGWLQGNRGETTRGGSLKSGIRTKIQSWFNSCDINLSRDKKDDTDILLISFGSKSNYSNKRNLKVFINNVELGQEDFKTIQENSKEFKNFLDNLKVLKSL